MRGMDSPALTRTQAQDAVAALGWRLLLGELVTAVPLDSLAEGAGLLTAVAVELGPDGDAHLRADLRPDRLRLALQDRARGVVTATDVDLARRVTELVDRPVDPVGETGVQELEIAVDALDIPAVRPFWAAVLDLVPQPGDEDALVDPAGRLPAVWFQQMDAARPQRNRIHLDITVPHDVAPARVAAALAAGGRLLSDDAARAFWVLADVEGNEVCVCTWQDRDRPGVSPAG
ncbi:4a-hydroxytetrahydrobiopterin dehydratase [Klenkia brasiliensis]|uniref:4a-hydroxytetrahydrobiopterin dehydratase n=2 Tax=Klenkia brasiliensis TaxID=333142 RepID=A0A1G7XJS7_9ACTN|nr:4a-hydroxytetrahydrobiopterin dehydratase [Klenkia brasiliensis]